MFVTNINAEQQGYLIALSKILMAVDGEVSREEIVIVEAIRSQCSSIPEQITDPLTGLAEVFSCKASKSCLLLELLGVAMADSNYHDKERLIINNVAEQIGIESAQLESMENWVNRQISLFKEAESFMEE